MCAALDTIGVSLISVCQGEFCVEGEGDELLASARRKSQVRVFSPSHFQTNDTRLVKSCKLRAHQLWAALTATMVVKSASSAAFAKHKRATTAPDVIQNIGETTEQLAPIS